MKMAEEQSTIILRIPSELKKEFEEICKRADSTISQEIRKFIRHQVTRNKEIEASKRNK